MAVTCWWPEGQASSPGLCASARRFPDRPTAPSAFGNAEISRQRPGALPTGGRGPFSQGCCRAGRGPAGRTWRRPRPWGPSAPSPSSPTSSGYRRETEARRRVRPGAQASSGETPGVLLGGGGFPFPSLGFISLFSQKSLPANRPHCRRGRRVWLQARRAPLRGLHRGPGPVLTLGRRHWVEARSFPTVGEQVLDPGAAQWP